jgi:hypothetical protein
MFSPQSGGPSARRPVTPGTEPFSHRMPLSHAAGNRFSARVSRASSVPEPYR